MKKSIFYSTIAFAGLDFITLAFPLHTVGTIQPRIYGRQFLETNDLRKMPPVGLDISDSLIVEEHPLDKRNKIFSRATEPVDNAIVTTALRFWNKLNKCVTLKYRAAGLRTGSDTTTPDPVREKIPPFVINGLWNECAEEIGRELELSQDELDQLPPIINRVPKADREQVALADDVGDYTSEGYDVIVHDVIFRKPPFMHVNNGGGTSEAFGDDRNGRGSGNSEFSLVHLNPLPNQDKAQAFHSTAPAPGLFKTLGGSLRALPAQLKAATTTNLQAVASRLEASRVHWPVFPGSLKPLRFAPL